MGSREATSSPALTRAQAPAVAHFLDRLHKARHKPQDFCAVAFERGTRYSWRAMERQVHSLREPGRGSTPGGGSQDGATRRREAEARGTAERARRVLSAVNRAVMRASDDGQLVQDVCQLLVTVGGYRLAWIGYVEDDAARSVRPVAAAGVDLGYVAAAHVTWSDEPRARGPVGVAIRSGRPDIVRDAHDPRIEPWREDARRRGYASAAALPLIVEGRPFGALAVYAGEPDAFHPTELDLLVETAGDIAYGISARRGQAQEARSAAPTSSTGSDSARLRCSST